MTKRMTTTVMNRSCGPCTACCRGSHTADVRGHIMHPGRPCHFFSDKCTIYEFRPDVCKNYFCAWMEDDRAEFAEWMRPDLSGVICDWRDWEGGRYLEVREDYKAMSADVLAWIYEFGARRNLDMKIKINGYWHLHGSERFRQEFEDSVYN